MNKMILSLITAAVAGLLVSASTRSAAGDFASFSRFITDRNIFNPGRQPYNPLGLPQDTKPHVQPNATQIIQLVGTMSYQKGMFAFFDGSPAKLSTVLQLGGKIAGCTITEVAANFVALESADTQKRSELKVGDRIQQVNGIWTSPNSSLPAAMASSSATESKSSTPAPSASAPNDVLKRLMEQREKENQ